MTSPLITRSAFALTVVLVIAIAYLLADAVWFFVAGPSDNHQQPQQSTNGAAATLAEDNSAQASVDMATIINANLFGVASANAPTTRASNEPPPVTRLALELLGIFQADVASESGAVIAEQRKEAEVYWVGDRLPGNATLASVHQDHVVIDRAGNLETLRFMEEGGGATSTSNFQSFGAPQDYAEPGFEGPDASFDDEPTYDGQEEVFEPEPVDEEEPSLGSPESGIPVSSIRESIEGYKDRLTQDPAAVLQEVGLQPITDGSAAGYRIGEGVNSGDLARVGLQSGDVVLSVNGRPVGDVQSDRQQMDAVLASGAARLEIQRGNRRFFVTASLQ